MSATIRPTTDRTAQTGYAITPIYNTHIVDWNGGSAVADEPDEERLREITMAANNETEIGYDRGVNYSPPDSTVLRGKDFYERLQAHNRDTWWAYRTDSTISQDCDTDFKSHLLCAFASELGLNSYQQACALGQFMNLDLRRGTGGVQENAFLLCAIIMNESAARYGDENVYHPQRPSGNNDDAFQKLADDLIGRFGRVTNSSLTKIYNKLIQGKSPTQPSSRWKSTVREETSIQLQPNYFGSQSDPNLQEK